MGIINPIIVQPLPGKYYRVVSGFRRFRVAKELGFSSVPVRILRENLSSVEVITVVLLSHPRPFTLTEKARIVSIMISSGLSPSQICQRFSSFLAIESTRLVEDYRQISKYPSPLLSYISAYGLSLKQALAFKWLSEEEQKIMVSLGTCLSLKGYDMYNILTNLREIAIREGESIIRIIKEAGLLDIQKNSRLSRSQKINKIKEILKERRYPYLTQVNRRLGELKKRVKFAPHMQIDWDEGLEKGIKLSLNVKDISDIKEAIERLSSQTNYALLSRFFKVYHEGLPDKKDMDR